MYLVVLLGLFSKSTFFAWSTVLDLDSSVATGKLKTCTTQSVQACHNVSFLVDIQALDDPMDIRADENGAWDRKGSPVTYISVHNGRGTTAVYKRNHMGSHSHHYKITRVYYRHSSSPDFTRIITTVNGKLVVARAQVLSIAPSG